MKQIFALLSGLIFGLGLIISGMADPAKVLNFLDLFGTWDPSLAFVMGGAIAVTAPGFARLFRKRHAPMFDTEFRLPTRKDLEPTLLVGAAIFGVGWGLGGFCPGPALTALPMAATGTLIFVPFMLAGMWAARNTPDLSLPRKKGTV
ncbi:YeeE/YedE family protein [Gymnodinialimonas ceratoperidinii]|uniref:YeeE/YedE family protein n=1 Tax=Gymnodinialimonas ceratoperidinii TaxID=2856823 RepID=A0A8F6TUA4_9RHOB|nr:YeeE/YedE family protein [Gymnodinialimonas ceratoperidinii]QXT38593.1 YeeE/YedE family protein [Gymnodinialimonas ceratoperidinii]